MPRADTKFNIGFNLDELDQLIALLNGDNDQPLDDPLLDNVQDRLTILRVKLKRYIEEAPTK